MKIPKLITVTLFIILQFAKAQLTQVEGPSEHNLLYQVIIPAESSQVVPEP
jgi:hypothetical protein